MPTTLMLVRFTGATCTKPIDLAGITTGSRSGSAKYGEKGKRRRARGEGLIGDYGTNPSGFVPGAVVGVVP